MPSPESGEWMSGEWWEIRFFNRVETVLVIQDVWDVSRCAWCGGVVVVRNILAFWSGVMSCDGRMLDDVEILVELDLNLEWESEELSLFGWIGECSEWKISTPAVVGGDEERIGRKNGTHGKVGIWAVMFDGNWSFVDKCRGQDVGIEEVYGTAEVECPVKKG